MHILSTIFLGGLELVRLAVTTRFRLRGPYWSWRWHTAFGRGTPPRGQLVWSLLQFGLWARRIRRL